MQLALTVTCRGTSYATTLTPDSTVHELQLRIEELSHISIGVQKLFVPRRGVSTLLMRVLKSHVAESTSLQDLGLRNGDKITVVGPTLEQLDAVSEAEQAWAKRNRPQKLHHSLLCGGAPRTTYTSKKTIFTQLQVNETIPVTEASHQRILSYLKRLAEDQAVVHVCELHGYTVGILTELLPHEHPGLLGLNENMGQRISLRIRTDDADGLRDYKTTRRVLLHELAHNEISGHPPEFKELNSRINREVDSFERAKVYGANRLTNTPTYQSEYEETADERRARILAATEARLALMDKEIDHSCGTHR